MNCVSRGGSQTAPPSGSSTSSSGPPPGRPHCSWRSRSSRRSSCRSLRTQRGASGVVDARFLGRLLVTGCLAVIALLAVAFVEVRRSRTGEWTAYLVIVLYGSWLATLVYAFGGWSTVFMGWALLVVVLVGVWYDERKGWAALGYFGALVTTIVVLTLVGAIEYAPGLVGRGIDDQNSLGFVTLVFTPLVGFFGFTFVATNLVVRAQRLQQERLRVAHALVRRYVPASVADGLDGRDGEDGFGVDRVKLTVFFSDIEGFTELADELDPEDLALVLNHYLEEMAQSAEAHGSSINHFEGDGIMIFFGAPARRPEAGRRVRGAYGLRHAAPPRRPS